MKLLNNIRLKKIEGLNNELKELNDKFNELSDKHREISIGISNYSGLQVQGQLALDTLEKNMGLNLVRKNTTLKKLEKLKSKIK